jgi:1-acyl-sn-glycerol-3-phosphate acyltransferase
VHKYDYTKLPDEKAFATAAKIASYVVPRLYKPLRCAGGENIPESGAFIFVCNHINAKDPAPLMYAAYPRRLLYFLAKEELFQKPPVAAFMKLMGSFPVRRGVGARPALQYALRLLEEGRAVGVFPEGTRTEDGAFLPTKVGAAYLAWHSGAPVVPAAIYSPDLGHTGSAVSVAIGQPIPAAALPFGDGKAAGRRAAAEQIFDAIRALHVQAKEMISDNRGGHP